MRRIVSLSHTLCPVYSSSVCLQDLLNALHLAAVGGHLEIVKYLMPKFGESKFDLDNLAQSCLHKAVREGHPKVVRYLIEEGGFDPSLRDKVSCR